MLSGTFRSFHALLRKRMAPHIRYIRFFPTPERFFGIYPAYGSTYGSHTPLFSRYLSNLRLKSRFTYVTYVTYASFQLLNTFFLHTVPQTDNLDNLAKEKNSIPVQIPLPQTSQRHPRMFKSPLIGLIPIRGHSLLRFCSISVHNSGRQSFSQ